MHVEIMNDNIHEPEIVADTKNAAAYFLVLAFVSGGVFLLVLGAVSPYFLPRKIRKAKALAKEMKTGTYEENYRKLRNKAILVTACQFIIAWALIICAYIMDPIVISK
jgi:hypothetical protein